ncbi:epididymal-specific lipocalin-8 isoform X2 [Octodon degus]|uniref:Epididymal-specific lipocalin-8 isoform X2 n=1 Tax=Octodon degus TaxID=10160 RepID=A0A6P6D7R7_OCTDE|nr:epididymal-specific lipocalin-8 isoform X2 [Octodon degus]
MESSTLSIVLGILAVLPAGGALADFDQRKIGGFWREVGVASDKNLALKTPRRAEGVFLTVNGSNLIVKVVFNNSGSCETETTVGSESDPAGFAFPGHREMHVLDTDYVHYAILRLSLLWRGQDFHVIKYFTRSLENEDELGFRKFREMTADTGLYLVARHGGCGCSRRLLGGGPPACPHAGLSTGRCAKLLKEGLI